MSSNPTWPQALHTLKNIDDKDPLFEHIIALHDGRLADLMDAIMHGQLPDRDTLRIVCGLLPLKPVITVDYGQTVERMIELGGYSSVIVSTAINSQVFPTQRTGTATLEPKLRRLSREMVLDGAITEFAEKGLRPGTHEELLAFGATYPEVVKRGGPIVALGSKGKDQGFEWMMNLTSVSDGRRGVWLVARDATLSTHERFLLFKK